MHGMVNIGVRAARRAGEIMVRQWNQLETLRITDKGRNDYVTQVDLMAEEAIIEVIRDHYPDHAVLAEERGAVGEHDFVWIIDPLDGTFKTLKYAPVFPERFGSLQDARGFMDEFTQYYNHEHHHTGIGLHTAADVHYGLTDAIDQRRHAALAAARTANPERFTSTNPPKVLSLPEAAWINPPLRQPETPETITQETLV
jgi:hypothetical protein